MLVLSPTKCPTCGAPIAVAEGRRAVICAYCDSSIRVERPAGAAATLRADEIPPEVIERVKSLVLDGRIDEAVSAYADASGLPREEAAQVVDELVLPAVFQLVKHAPKRPAGIFVLSIFVGGLVALAGWAAMRAVDSPIFIVLAVLPVLLSLWIVKWALPGVTSTFIMGFGSEGHGRVLERKVLRTMPRGGVILLVLFEVTPTAGGAPFLDEEVFVMKNESVHKLEPGNVIQVRYGRGRVFPSQPVTVVRTARAS